MSEIKTPREFTEHFVKTGFKRNLQVIEWECDNPNAPVLFCVPGVLQTAISSFAYLANNSPDYRVIAVTPIGRGKSDWDPKANYSLKYYIDDLLEVIKYFELKDINWIGTSMGGLLGMMMVDKVSVRHLVLNDIAPSVPLKGIWALSKRMSVMGNISFVDFAEAFQKISHTYKEVLTNVDTENDEVLKQVSKDMLRQDGKVLKFHYDPKILNTITWDTLFLKLWKEFKAVRCPITVIHGEKSLLLTKKLVNKMRKKTISKEFAVITLPDIGHAPLLDSQADVDKLLKHVCG